MEGRSMSLHRVLCPGAQGECLEDAYPGVNLHLGCGGKRWEGWENVDFGGAADTKADLRALPFADNYADQAAAIHVVEHFYLWEVEALLREWKRVLKPGGYLVLELPCMDKILHYMSERLKAQEPMDIQMTWLALWGDPGHRRPEMCHKWGYTKQQITDELQAAGFADVRIEQPRYHVLARDMRVVGRKPEAA